MIYGMFNDIMEAGAVLMVNFEFISFLKFCGQFHIFFCHTWAQFFHLTQKQHFEFNSIPCNYRQYLLCIFCLQAHKISVIDNVMVSQCSTFRISSGTLREKNDEKYKDCYSSQNQKLGICSQTSWQRTYLDWKPLNQFSHKRRSEMLVFQHNLYVMAYMMVYTYRSKLYIDWIIKL
jgi:hypothetical protein